MPLTASRPAQSARSARRRCTTANSGSAGYPPLHKPGRMRLGLTRLSARHLGDCHVALTKADRALLERCLGHKAGAWNDFVDRFLGLIYHVIHHTAHLRSFPLQPEDTEDIAAEVLLQIVGNDYAAIRQFRGTCSLATYLTVIARRICVHELARRGAARE